MNEVYTGFKIFNLEFQAMTKETPGVSVEMIDGVETGRLSIPATGAKYWTQDDKGLKAHLEDFLAPMCEVSANGCGWSLDTDLYERLNNLPDDPVYEPFKSRNPLLYTSKTTSGSKSVKLVPTTYTRVMCFKHTSGYKAMIGLSLYAMDANNYLHEYFQWPYYGTYSDPGFNAKHIYVNYPIENPVSSNTKMAIGGLFISMIPPKEDGSPQDDWNLELDITDEKFFCPTMTKIIPMIHTHSYSSSYNYSYSNGCSWLKVGTSTEYDANESGGVLVGTNMKLSLLLDSKANIGLSYKYTADTNTTYLNPIIITGPLYKKKIHKDDTLPTRYIGSICFGIGYTETSPDRSGDNSAWKGNYSNSYYRWMYGEYGLYPYIGSFNRDASDFGGYRMYTAYPALSSNVMTNYRFAKAGYSQMGLIDEEVIRWTKPEGLVKGQTYNDGEWIYMGSDYSAYTTDDVSGNSAEQHLYPSIRWDGNANGTKTFA